MNKNKLRTTALHRLIVLSTVSVMQFIIVLKMNFNSVYCINQFKISSSLSDSTKEEIRLVICFLVSEGLKEQILLVELNVETTVGSNMERVVSIVQRERERQTYEWISSFKNGQISLCEERRKVMSSTLKQQ